MDESAESGASAGADGSDAGGADTGDGDGGDGTAPGFEATLHSNGVEFGERDSALLRAIDETGSLNAAATTLGRSYSHAHRRLAALESAFGPLVESQRGGADGGGSTLTARAERVLARFERLRTAFSGVAEVTETVFRGRVVERTGSVVAVDTDAGQLHAVGPVDATAVHVTVRADTVTLHRPDGDPQVTGSSARNQLPGTVASVERHDALVSIGIDVGADRLLTALLTAESCNRLDLARGVEVVASFKTTATRVTPQR
jgi:molybdate transport system regulatory protein